MDHISSIRPPKLIIFDCDGVLVDSEGITTALIAASITKYGLPMSDKEATLLFVGGTMMSAEQEARRLGANLPDDWLDEIYGEIYTGLALGVELVPGVMDIIARAEENRIAIAVASNGTVQKMRITLGPSGLWDRLSPQIYSREHHTPKPAPDMLIHAMNIAGVDAASTVMIDDSPSGCQSAINAGVRCLGYAAEGQGPRLAETGAEVHETMASIQAAIGL